MYFSLQSRLWISAIAALLLSMNLAAFAQEADKEEDEGPPPKEDWSLTTGDGVRIACDYYPGTEGKKTIPIILLHGFEGNKEQLAGLADTLQRAGHAVAVPDLRGHGGSTTQNLSGGRERELELDRMTRDDFMRMVNDVQAVASELRDEHIAEKLNLDLLCVVGADMGAVVAMNWSVYDWTRDSSPHFVLGRSVKALVLASPPQSFKGLTLKSPLMNPVVRSKISTMILVGNKDARTYSDAKRLYSTLKRYHAPIPSTAEERRDKQDLFFFAHDTTLQGEKLLKEASLKADQQILGFIRFRLENKRDDFPRQTRKNPFVTD